MNKKFIPAGELLDLIEEKSKEIADILKTLRSN